MIKDITLGQYFPGSSPVHKMDARVKISASLLLIAAIFFSNGLIATALVICAIFTLILLSKISLGVIFKGLKPLIFIMLFTVVIQILLTRTGELWLEWYFIKIYSDGIYNSVKMIIRITLLISATSVLLSYTTSPIMLTDGIEGLLKPLSKLGVKKVHDFAMMMSIALRFIPTLIEESEKIMASQKARGTDFSQGSLLKRAKALLPIFIPLLFSSIRRAEELSVAMICRCYRGGEGRTKLNEPKMRACDWVWLALFILFTALIVALNFVKLPELTYGISL